MTKKYGKTEQECHAESMFKCRQIMTEILNFGVSERQLLQLAYLISLELENRKMLENISKCVQECIDEYDTDESSIVLD